MSSAHTDGVDNEKDGLDPLLGTKKPDKPPKGGKFPSRPMNWQEVLVESWARTKQLFQGRLVLDEDLNNDHYPDKAIKHDRYEDKRDGYPRLAAWIASDPNFAIGRDYGDLRVRCRLQKQFRVEKLKAELEEMDRLVAEDGPRNLGNIGDDFNRPPETRFRDILLEKINQELKEYDEIMLRELKFRALPRPTKRNYYSLLYFLYNSDEIRKEERFPLYYKDEMVSLAAGRDNSWMDERLEEVLEYIPGSHKIFTDEAYWPRSDDAKTHYYSQPRIEILSKAITILSVAVFIAVPVGVLAKLSKSQTLALAIVISFVICFPVFLAACSRLKQQEVFAVSAAYAAVLVVFLSNIPQNLGNCACKTK